MRGPKYWYRNYNRWNRIPPILLKIYVLVEGTGSYSEKKSVRSTLPKLGDTAIWNFGKCNENAGPDKSRHRSKLKNLLTFLTALQGLSRWSCVFILDIAFLIHIALMYFEKKMCSTNFTVRNLIIPNWSAISRFPNTFFLMPAQHNPPRGSNPRQRLVIKNILRHLLDTILGRRGTREVPRDVLLQSSQHFCPAELPKYLCPDLVRTRRGPDRSGHGPDKVRTQVPRKLGWTKMLPKL